jgi:hypothetical protein
MEVLIRFRSKAPYFYPTDTPLELNDNGTLNLESKIKFSLSRRVAASVKCEYYLVMEIQFLATF